MSKNVYRLFWVRVHAYGLAYFEYSAMVQIMQSTINQTLNQKSVYFLENKMILKDSLIS